MNKILIATFFISMNSYAALNMSAGLWELDVKVKTKGKERDPRAEIQKALAKMAPEQRKKMESIMASMGAGVSSDGAIKVCYSQEMIKKNSLTPEGKVKSCKTSVTTVSPEKMITKFNCEDGTTGVATWNMESNEKLTGLVEMNKKGEDSTISYKGKFVNKDCGAIRPVL
jgi:hypothetical protein